MPVLAVLLRPTMLGFVHLGGYFHKTTVVTHHSSTASCRNTQPNTHGTSRYGVGIEDEQRVVRLRQHALLKCGTCPVRTS